MLSGVSDSLTIGELARRAGVGVETVRFYEHEGLVIRPRKPFSGFRHCPPEAVERVVFIRRAKELGFSLEEIADLLSLRVTQGPRCDAVRAYALHKVAAIDEKLAVLHRIRDALATLADACNGREGMAECTILDAIGCGASGADGAPLISRSIKARTRLKCPIVGCTDGG